MYFMKLNFIKYVLHYYLLAQRGVYLLVAVVFFHNFQIFFASQYTHFSTLFHLT